MIANYGKIYNTVSIEETELESLMLMAMMVYSAVARKGSRGGYTHDDYKGRNDANWTRHTLYFSGGARLDYHSAQGKPLMVEIFPPKKRIY